MMKMKTGMVQEQSLKLHLTHELKQSLALLQYNSIELEQYVRELALENPLIEISEHQIADVFYHKKHRDGRNRDSNPIEAYTEQRMSLLEYLIRQLRVTDAPERHIRGAEILSAQLNENGYLMGDAAEILAEYGYAGLEAHQSLKLLQSMDPAGVGAADLQECLILQLQRLGNKGKTAEKLIDRHFNLFAGHSFKELSKASGCTLKEVQAAYDLVRTLLPKPGSLFQNEPTSYVIPDLMMEKTDGVLQAEYNSVALPEVQISSRYSKYLGGEDVDHYLSAKRQQGMWLLKSIHQRKETMVKIMKEIAQRQSLYFHTGKAGDLKPLTLSCLADACGVHESTVSRAIRGKYVQTPYGMLEMRFFLTNRLPSQTDEAKSAAGAKEMIAKLIELEDKAAPLSDQMLAAALLDSHEVKISRRTVAKYREQLKIPPSSHRKRYSEAFYD
ncbi:RNA polymerase factor sigma-54 [Bacillus mangrovi]|uniref:RNA polymerase factor sigma-54 n=1 Tax=Metabacillus mangrovi TaxID=1491830 RepID=A0A7X2S5B4_9BACI|nr:RNA polymerase factor sigma-54 [Metabacillus mangrovi]MTH53795.1 RNA polymerase factor sigma-54 [Metabacillus mangrovi]